MSMKKIVAMSVLSLSLLAASFSGASTALAASSIPKSPINTILAKQKFVTVKNYYKTGESIPTQITYAENGWYGKLTLAKSPVEITKGHWEATYSGTVYYDHES